MAGRLVRDVRQSQSQTKLTHWLDVAPFRWSHLISPTGRSPPLALHVRTCSSTTCTSSKVVTVTLASAVLTLLRSNHYSIHTLLIHFHFSRDDSHSMRNSGPCKLRDWRWMFLGPCFRIVFQVPRTRPETYKLPYKSSKDGHVGQIAWDPTRAGHRHRTHTHTP